jgi:type IV secretory pathway VirB3-like protein
MLGVHVSLCRNHVIKVYVVIMSYVVIRNLCQTETTRNRKVKPKVQLETNRNDELAWRANSKRTETYELARRANSKQTETAKVSS